MIKNFKMDWGTEEHTFTFDAADRVEAVDLLNDLIGSLEYLREHIGRNYNFTEDLPVFYVVGGQRFTEVGAKKVAKP